MSSHPSKGGPHNRRRWSLLLTHAGHRNVIGQAYSSIDVIGIVQKSSGRPCSVDSIKQRFDRDQRGEID
jgi:hypothetical protein